MGKSEHSKIIIRRFEPGDETTLWQIYYDTTHIVNGRDYTPEQCERWAPKNCDWEKWRLRLEKTRPFLAQVNETVVGFAELESGGAIGHFYCHHQWIRHGIGRLLFEALEKEAISLGFSELKAAVSTTAQPFFSKMGFEVVSENEKIICGAVARNFNMRKLL